MIELTDKPTCDYVALFISSTTLQPIKFMDIRPIEVVSNEIVEAIRNRRSYTFNDGTGIICYIPSSNESLTIRIITNQVWEKEQSDARYHASKQQQFKR